METETRYFNHDGKPVTYTSAQMPGRDGEGLFLVETNAWLVRDLSDEDPGAPAHGEAEEITKAQYGKLVKAQEAEVEAFMKSDAKLRKLEREALQARQQATYDHCIEAGMPEAVAEHMAGMPVTVGSGK